MVVGTGLTTSVSLWLSWFWVHTGHFSQVFWLQVTCAPCVCGSGNRSSTHFLCLALVRVICTLSSSGFGDGWSTYFGFGDGWSTELLFGFGDGCSAQFVGLWWRVIYTLSLAGFVDEWSIHFLWLALVTGDLHSFWLWLQLICAYLLASLTGHPYPFFWLHLLVTHTPSSGFIYWSPIPLLLASLTGHPYPFFWFALI